MSATLSKVEIALWRVDIAERFRAGPGGRIGEPITADDQRVYSMPNAPVVYPSLQRRGLLRWDGSRGGYCLTDKGKRRVAAARERLSGARP